MMNGIPELKRTVSLPAMLRADGMELIGSDPPMGQCPFHTDRTPSLAVYEDHWHCFGCGAHGDAIGWLRRTRGLGFAEALRLLRLLVLEGAPVSPVVMPPAAADGGADAGAGDAERCRLALEIWRDALPLSCGDALAWRYLQGRGLVVPLGLEVIGQPAPWPLPLRFHPGCPRGSERLPAMLALMTDPLTGDPCGVHRTYLRVLPDGAVVKVKRDAKRMLGRAGLVRLEAPRREPDGRMVLGAAEGIEAALGARMLFAVPCWAACSAGGVRTLPVLPEIDRLIVFADGDRVGIAAAEQCAQRWRAAGRETTVMIAPPGRDWANVQADAARARHPEAA